MEWVGKLDSVPIEVANAIAATLWLLEVEAFRAQEEDFMISGVYDTSLSEHRAILSEIIGRGEMVVHAVKQHGLTDTPAGFQLKDLQATLNSLHATFRGEHGSKSPEKTAALIERLLNG